MMLNGDSNENCKKINSLFSKNKKTNKQTNNFSSAAQTVAWASGWTYGHVTIKCIDNQFVFTHGAPGELRYKFMIEFEKNICNVIKRLISLLLGIM